MIQPAIGRAYTKGEIKQLVSVLLKTSLSDGVEVSKFEDEVSDWVLDFSSINSLLLPIRAKC